MKHRPACGRILSCALLAAAAGCAQARAPVAPAGSEAAATEQARRAERLKIMQEYWQAETVTGRERGMGPARPPPLEYPAGTYSGINFAPRLAPDPSLAEPNR